MSAAQPETAARPERLAAVRLALVPDLGGAGLRRLLAAVGAGDEQDRLLRAARATPHLLRRALRVGGRRAARLARALRRADPEAELRAAAEAGVEVLAVCDPDYPAALRALPDPPMALYRRGAYGVRDGLAVAVTGTRSASAYGTRTARSLAGDLARAGVTVIAGLGRGIDVAAHEGALEAGGRTLAVLPSGLLAPYPPEHAPLLERICAQGAAFSELPLRSGPGPSGFARRARLMAVLGLAVLVVEAGERSGALAVVRQALETGREVLAVPGPVDSPTSRGTLRLLQEGAAPVGSSQDVFQVLGWCASPALSLPPDEARVLQRLSALDGAAGDLERMAEAAGVSPEVVAAHLLTLELRGLVARTAEGNYVVL